MIFFSAQVVGAVFVLASLFDKVYDQSSAILDVAAVAVIAGTVMAYNRVKAALVAAESTGKSWHEERDAAVSRAEREEAARKAKEAENVQLLAKVVVLEQRPDLSRLESLVSTMNDSMLRHEEGAADRTKQLVGAIERITPPAT